MNPLIEGLFLGISLIAAIGAQNLFILRQGISNQQLLTACTTCALCDFLLIALGAMGLGSLIAHIEWLRKLALMGGVAFLGYYGWRAFYQAIFNTSHEVFNRSKASLVGRQEVFMQALGFSLLNPHALLDTIVLIGSLSGQYAFASERALFAIGAGIASLVWFFSLGYAARLIGPLFEKPFFARMLDLCVGLLMSWIAWNLICMACLWPPYTR